MLVITSWLASNEFMDFYQFSSVDFYSKNHILILVQIFRVPFYVILTVFGLFFRIKYGWILVAQYFYFLLWNLFSILIIEWENDIRYLLVFLFFLVLNSILIYLLNHPKVFYKTFNLKKNKAFLNMIAFIIGFGLSLINLIIKTW
jgi:hypothetical protein